MKRRGRRFPVYFSGSIVVLGAAVAAWWLWPEGETRQDAASTKRGLIKEVTPAVAPKAEEAKPKEKDPHEGFVLSSQGVWQPKGRPYRYGRKKVHAVITNGVGSGVSVASNKIEQLMLNIFSRERGDMPLPFPDRLTKADMDELVPILMDKHPVSEKDSERVKYDKETLRIAKQAMTDWIRQGGDPYEFLKNYHEELCSTYFQRQDAIRMTQQMVKDGEDPEIIDEFIRRVNGKFRDSGIKTYEIPWQFYRSEPPKPGETEEEEGK